MTGRLRVLRRGRNLILCTAFAVVAILAVAIAAQPSSTVVTYRASGATFFGIRPTAVGLPQIGEHGTIGVGEFIPALEHYHDSGAYERDLAAVDGAAQRDLNRRLANKRPRKPAIVLDIDETALSNYAGLVKSGFTANGLFASEVTTTVPIEPTLALYRDARRHHVTVFFITGRPATFAATTNNLRAAGYTAGFSGPYFRPDTEGVEAFKSSTRAAIQKRGYDIIVNVGDQESDLDGGHADADFKLPDPFYFVANR